MQRVEFSTMLELAPGEFRRLAGEVIALADQYLESLDQTPIAPRTTGAEMQHTFHTPAPETGMGREALAALHEVIANSRVQNGRFFGYVLGSGEPVGALADLLASVLNQNVSAWRSSPAAVRIEQTVIEWLAGAIGCSGFHGSLAGGGSSANLMGLTMARESKLSANEAGLCRARQAVIYASTEVHMSIPKAIAMLGLGRSNLRSVPVNSDFRMNVDELDRMVAEDQSGGKLPIAVVASAGTVNTGAIDPFTDIAGVARRYGLWLHVDGAYGALAAMARPDLFAGLSAADSISLDPHKWLYQPVDCGCLLYKDAAVARSTFAYTGDYAKTLSADPVESFAFFEESMELSRRFRALKLWLSLRYHGLSAFRQSIASNLDLAQRLAARITDHPELELLAPVTLSAVCFRFRPTASSPEDLNQLNSAVLKRVVQRGRVYLSNATIRGQFALRACITNHRTTAADVDAVMDEVLAAATELA